MAIVSSVCPGCSAAIDDGDKFCQDCGLHLPGFSLRSPLLRPESEHLTIEKPMLSPMVLNRRHNRMSLIWQSACAAEVLLLAGMLFYAGGAVLFVQKKAPELLSFHSAPVAISRSLSHNKIFNSGGNPLSSIAASFSKQLSQFTAKSTVTNLPATPGTKGATVFSNTQGLPSSVTKKEVLQSNNKIISNDATTVSVKSSVVSVNNSKHAVASSVPSSGEQTVAATAENSELTKLVKKHDEIDNAFKPAIAVTNISSLQQIPDESAAPIAGQQLSDVAQYNKLLASYFTHRNKLAAKPTAIGPTNEPPTYQEWIDMNKQTF